jgi:adenosine kinase
VDITSEIGTDMIEKFGLKLGNSVLVDEKESEYTTEVFGALESMPAVGYIPGGSAQNTIRVISWCLNMEPERRKKFKVSMLGSIGDDAYQKKIFYALKEIGVNPILEILKDDKTSRCGVGIFKKEKCFVTQLRASKRLSELFLENNRENIFSHQAVLIEGYMLNNCFNICKKICENFHKNNKLVILTLSATFIIKFHNQKLIEIANDADIIAGNIEEAVEMADNKGNDIQEIYKIIFRKLKENNNRLLLITDGPNGVYCGKYNYDEQKLEYLWTFSANKVKNDEIQDLNGAGDAFLGGFLSQYMKGNSIEDCCHVGIDAATEIIKNVGCTFPKSKNLLYKF